MRKSIKSILTILMAFTVIFGIVSCSAEEAAIPMLTDNTPSYEDVKKKIDLFDEVYGNYVYHNQEELKGSSGEGYTPLGNSCVYTYVTNIEGKNKADTVRSCTLEITHDDGSMVVDEYFAVDNQTLFIVRTTNPGDGTFGEVFKYVVLDNTLYEINEKEATLTQVEKADTLDLYLSFAEIKDLYGTTN